jgi:hypothetical protein
MASHSPTGRGGIALGLDNLDLELHFLMTQYAARPDPERARAVAHHLAMVLDHPTVAEQPEYRAFYQQQLTRWQGLADTGRETAGWKSGPSRGLVSRTRRGLKHGRQ